MEAPENLRDLFLAYEDSSQVKSILSGIPQLDNDFTGIVLDPGFHENNDAQRWLQVSITFNVSTALAKNWKDFPLIFARKVLMLLMTGSFTED